MDRKSGVLMHISSLFGDYSIGDFGPQGKFFVDFLTDCGFSYWQVLPFGPADSCNSPYKSTSSFAGNPYFVSLDILKQKGLLTENELLLQKQHTPYVCEYRRLYNERLNILKIAAGRITDKSEIESFITKNPYINNFCKFMAMKHANSEKPWYEWEHENYSDEILFLWQFIQYEFFTQWAQIKQYAYKKGLKIIGDVPFYVDLDSSDVWADKHLFKLDTNNLPVSIAGVPPDYFSQDGQLWGNPIYDWNAMEKEDFRWWKDRMSNMASLFDSIRIDHFRAIESFWEVPANAKTAKEGVMTKGPGMKFIDAVKNNLPDAMIIAEDLGIITEEVVKLLKMSGFPGMRVFQFAFMGDKNSPHLPHNYPNHCVAYTGTHDNNTLLGYLWELDDNTRKHMLKYCGHNENSWQNGCDAILRTMFASHAGLVIMPIQDLLGFGADTRLNIPGKAEGNWEYRITREQLDRIDRAKFRRMNELYSRT